MTLIKMYDGITPSSVPAGAPAYMGYLNGTWPSYDAFVKMYPKARHVSVSITASADIGDVLDVENGDATPAQAPAWVVKRRAAGAHWVAVYTNDSSWESVRQAFTAAKVAEPYWMVAAYPGIGPTLESGTIAHQYESTAGYDTSVVDSTWLNMIGTPTPKPKPKPVPKPKPTPKPKGQDVKLAQTLTGKTTITGKCIIDSTVPWANRGPVVLNATNGLNASGAAYPIEAAGHVRAVVTGAPRRSAVTVDIYTTEA